VPDPGRINATRVPVALTTARPFREFCGPPERAGRSNGAAPPRRAATAGVSILVFASIAFCAQAGTDKPEASAANQNAGAEQICRTAVGGKPGEARSDACVSSLSDPMQGVARSRARQQARSECLQKGDRPGSPERAGCVLQSSDAPAAIDIQVWRGGG
jgi:hypothetical protein